MGILPALLLAAAAVQGDVPEAPERFRVERLLDVPPDQGSWVAMTFDDRGRLIVSPQEGPLRRVSVGETPPRVETLGAPVGDAQGLLWAFGGLYVNGKGPSGCGFYRLRDRDGSGRLDEVRLLRPWPIEMTEHGPHGIVAGPDGKVYVVVGNYTRPLAGVSPRSPHRNYREDLLLPRQWDATGHAVGLLAPGGVVLRTDPEGREWEVFCGGLRNSYDLAFNPDGELFTYDSDMERDLGTPWYRPTRVFHLVSGGDYGWRSGTGKWSPGWPDAVPPIVDVGRGSPTGLAFGTHSRFPERYRRALFAADWAFGRILAVHLSPKGATYDATFEPFVAGRALNVTDLEFGPDGAMYFITGGRGTRSTLYRVSYDGPAGPEPAPSASPARELRHRLERGHADAVPVDELWPSLGSADRSIRTAARIALERQPVESWRGRALSEADRRTALTALLALARAGAKEDLGPFVDALARLSGAVLEDGERVELLRLYQLAFLRLSPPEADVRARALAALDPRFPSGSDAVDRELAPLLVFLGAPGVVSRSLSRIRQAHSQEEATHYVFVLRTVRDGWTPEERREYFSWFGNFSDYKGDFGFPLFLRNIRSDALATMSDAERKPLEPLLESQFRATARIVPPSPDAVVHRWTVEELAPEIEKGLGRRNLVRGKASFAKAQCLACHRLAGEGGAVGPDLSGLAKRFSRRDILEAIVLPSKNVADQYQNTMVQTADGDVHVGRLIAEDGDTITLRPDPLGDASVVLPKRSIARRKPSALSPMPEGLMDTLSRLEVLDLLAFLEADGRVDAASR
jgi:putative heme-binding domain-containing protein